jgi:hypothetical protein
MANDDDLRLKSFPTGSFFVFCSSYFPNFAIISGRINLWITTIKSSDGTSKISAVIDET